MCKCVHPPDHTCFTVSCTYSLTSSSVSASANGETWEISILQSKTFLFALHSNGCHMIVAYSYAHFWSLSPSLSIVRESFLSSVADPFWWLLVSPSNNFYPLIVAFSLTMCTHPHMYIPHAHPHMHTPHCTVHTLTVSPSLFQPAVHSSHNKGNYSNLNHYSPWQYLQSSSSMITTMDSFLIPMGGFNICHTFCSH